jgi:hypothetical protein
LTDDTIDLQPIRTYEVVTRDLGSFRIKIPETWKVTYGPVVGAKGDGGQFQGNALRVWESDTKQRALFMGVISFCDRSIEVEV